MKKVYFKRGALALAAVMTLSAVSLCGCGSKSASTTGENIVKNENSENGREYDVVLDERNGDEGYKYAEDDLALVDTVSGKKISLGMSRGEIEEVAGESYKTDGVYKYYDGVIVGFIDDVAEALVTGSGPFEGEAMTRYKTSRGVYIGMPGEDFKKAYGDEYNESSERTGGDGEVYTTASNASRYFKKSGSKMEYVGETTDGVEDTENLYLQDFMFSKKDGTVATIKIANFEKMNGR